MGALSNERDGSGLTTRDHECLAARELLGCLDLRKLECIVAHGVQFDRFLEILNVLTESALLIAMAIVLELVAKAFIPEMPFGGQVTLVSMLPIVLISYRHGVKWGLLSGVVYAALEMVIGAKTVAAAFQPDYFGSGVLIVNALLMCLLDYVLAFTILGIGGCFRNKIQNPGLSLCLGSIVALSCRYLCHILSGYILFGSYAEWFFTQEGFPAWGANLVASLNPQLLALAYSVVYNGMYMIPEIVFTAVAALLLSKVPGIVKKV